jgi:hypothetical protein
VLVKDFRAIELGLALNGLNNLIERQGIYKWNHLGSPQKNSKHYECIKKTMKAIQNFANKRYSMHPIF